MKTNKQTLIVCAIITIVSFLALFILHMELDVWFWQIITKTEITCDVDERNFYQGIWSNIFTGAIVSVLTTYVVYQRSKHDVEFGLQASEDMLLMHFSSLASTMYMVNLKNPQNNHAAIARFADAIANCEVQYDRMIQCSNDYSPFFKTKKAKTLMKTKSFLQVIWIEICPVEDSLLVETEEVEIKKAIDKVRDIVGKKKDEIDELKHRIWRL